MRKQSGYRYDDSGDVKESKTLMGKTFWFDTLSGNFVFTKKKYYGCLAAGLLLLVLFLASLSLFLAYLPDPPLRSTAPNPSLFHPLFDQFVSAASIGEYIKNFSSIPHLAGTPQDNLQAVETQKYFESFHLKTRVESHPILLTYPVSRSVEVLSPFSFNCSLKEEIENDGTSAEKDIPLLWNGWSASGDAIGELVYANYGREEDFELIKDVDLTGKVVIIRYGQIFRGNKAHFAEARGAAAVLLYTDPEDYAKGPAYPNGPWATNSTAARGSVWLGNGDPETQGWASVPNGPRRPLSEAQNGGPYNLFPNLPTIPIQPLSYGDAQRLLEGLGVNPVPAEDWGGGFNLSHIGPGPVVVRVKVDVQMKQTDIWNVIGVIEGEVEPERVLLLGSHRDAWTFGAVDPISGHSILMETARGLGHLLEQGWKPRRSIAFCSWDAEEYGLMGSFEFTEKWHQYLKSSAIAYLNLDTAVTGGDILALGGSPAFQNMLLEITESITFPRSVTNSTQISLQSLWKTKQLSMLGSGSDYTSFIQALGIPSLSFDLDSSDYSYPSVYHSSYDSFYWVSHFGDPEYLYHHTVTRFVGKILLTLADSPVLPFDYRTYGTFLQDQVDALQEVGSSLNYTFIHSVVSNFQQSAQAVYEESLDAKGHPQKSYLDLNDRLVFTERAFLGDAQTSGHGYYLHVVSTPSDSNTYGGAAFPAVYDALLEGDNQKAQFVMDRIAIIIQEASTYLSHHSPSSTSHSQL